MRNLLYEIEEEVKTISSSCFDIELSKTGVVPSLKDPDITFDDFDNYKKKCKVLETCVLYVDIRKSTRISFKHNPETLAKLYSSFVRSMVKASEYFSGYVRNIIGDRIMVIFDEKNCFSNAINTAYLLNTISRKIINKFFKINIVRFRCGIGIDFGKMLVTKTGTIKKGKENEFYKSLVWLGRPANIASKLTDKANKYSPKSILATKEVLKGLKDESLIFYLKNLKHWSIQDVKIPDYTGRIYGSNKFFKESDYDNFYETK